MINLPAKGRENYEDIMKGCTNDDFPKEAFMCDYMLVYDFRNDACHSAGRGRRICRRFRTDC